MSGCADFNPRLQHGALGLGFAGAHGRGLVADSCAALKLFVNVARILTDAFWFSAGKAEVGAMTSLGVFATGTPGLAARDHALGQPTSAHGVGAQIRRRVDGGGWEAIVCSYLSLTAYYALS
jgi:hypothetical protein